jgi:hypothetical protein
MKIFDSYQQKQIFLAKAQIWHPRTKLKKKLLFCYKDYLYDHSLYALLLKLKLDFTNIDSLRFLPEERPRANPGLSSKKLFQKIERYKPDILFAYEKILSPAEIDHVLSLGIQLVTFTCGYSSYSYGGMSPTEAIENLVKHSLYLVPHAPHVSTLCNAGVNAREFPFWFEPSWFYPLGREKLFDILFVGDFTTPLNKNRLELLEQLAKSYKIAVASEKKPALANIHHLGSTTHPHTLNEWINSSYIVIGSDRLAEKDLLNKPNGQNPFPYDDEFFIRQRTYLTLGAGACYCVERHREIEKKFADGKEIVLWDSYGDLIDKVGYLLKNRAERDAIAANAAIRSLNEHATPVRVEQLVQML